jgi:hypothetical protein
MSEDPRCCGTGTCIINTEGVCWCGQVWDGEKMCMPTVSTYEASAEIKNSVDITEHGFQSSRNPSLKLD